MNLIEINPNTGLQQYPRHRDRVRGALPDGRIIVGVSHLGNLYVRDTPDGSTSTLRMADPAHPRHAESAMHQFGYCNPPH